MREDLLKIKSILFVAGAGFIFSFFTGLLSGNPLSIILGRSFIGTVFFTVIVTAALYVLKKNLPGMSELLSGSDDKDITDNAGGNLDITIEDDNPYQFSEMEAPDTADEEHLLRRDFIEEVEEESIDDIGKLDSVDDSEEVIEVMDDSMNSDSLPELEENTSFFTGSSDSTIGSRGSNDALDKLGGNVDPETMAKAIKTIIKKDQ
jgi:hypothetical protein